MISFKKVCAGIVFVLLFNIITFNVSVVGTAKGRGYLWPAPGISALERGYNSSHTGIDIKTPVGTNLIATKSGVIWALYNGCYHFNSGASDANHNYGFGNGLIIKHDDGTWAEYAHMQPDSFPNDVYLNARVVQGQILGKSGSSGNSTGPHLHFRLKTGGTTYWNATLLNPSDWVDYNDIKINTSHKLKDGIYSIKLAVNGKYLSAGRTKENGFNTTLLSWRGCEDQKFVFKRQLDNTYSITSLYSGKALDVRMASYDYGADICQSTWVGNANQRWYVMKSGSGYKLIAKHSGKAIDISNYGPRVQQWVDNNGGMQVFKILKGTRKIPTPTIVKSLKLASTTKGVVSLKWSKKIKNAVGYEIYRSLKSDSGYMRIATLDAESNANYTDYGLVSKKKYFYKVRAFNQTNGKKLYSPYSRIRSKKVR